jgi:hypothetical protein
MKLALWSSHNKGHGMLNLPTKEQVATWVLCPQVCAEELLKHNAESWLEGAIKTDGAKGAALFSNYNARVALDVMAL